MQSGLDMHALSLSAMTIIYMYVKGISSSGSEVRNKKQKKCRKSGPIYRPDTLQPQIDVAAANFGGDTYYFMAISYVVSRPRDGMRVWNWTGARKSPATSINCSNRICVMCWCSFILYLQRQPAPEWTRLYRAHTIGTEMNFTYSYSLWSFIFNNISNVWWKFRGEVRKPQFYWRWCIQVIHICKLTRALWHKSGFLRVAYSYIEEVVPHNIGHWQQKSGCHCPSTLLIWSFVGCLSGSRSFDSRAHNNCSFNLMTDRK